MIGINHLMLHMFNPKQMQQIIIHLLYQLMIHHDHRYQMLKKKTLIHITSMEIIYKYLTVYLQRLKNKLAIDYAPVL
jgi:hypothetical protein